MLFCFFSQILFLLIFIDPYKGVRESLKEEGFCSDDVNGYIEYVKDGKQDFCKFLNLIPKYYYRRTKVPTLFEICGDRIIKCVRSNSVLLFGGFCRLPLPKRIIYDLKEQFMREDEYNMNLKERLINM